jgi:hypothetical protein
LIKPGNFWRAKITQPDWPSRGSAERSNIPYAIIMADQSVPPSYLSMSSKQCIKIMIVKKGSLRELVDKFLHLLENRQMNIESMVMLFAATYTEELISARLVIQEKTGRVTRVIPMPPILLGG